MTQPHAAQPKRPRRPDHECEATRMLARDAAEAGERLASIRRRLRIPRSTLADWAKADGFRMSDIAARRAGEQLAAAREEGRADAIREKAEAAWREAWDGEDARTPSGMAKRVGLARARAALLLEEGLIDEAEAELAGVRRILRLLSFAAPVTKLLGDHLVSDEELYNYKASVAWVFAQPEEVQLSIGHDAYHQAVNAQHVFRHLPWEEKRSWIEGARERARISDAEMVRWLTELQGEET